MICLTCRGAQYARALSIRTTRLGKGPVIRVESSSFQVRGSGIFAGLSLIKRRIQYCEWRNCGCPQRIFTGFHSWVSHEVCRGFKGLRHRARNLSGNTVQEFKYIAELELSLFLTTIVAVDRRRVFIHRYLPRFAIVAPVSDRNSEHLNTVPHSLTLHNHGFPAVLYAASP